MSALEAGSKKVAENPGVAQIKPADTQSGGESKLRYRDPQDEKSTENSKGFSTEARAGQFTV